MKVEVSCLTTGANRFEVTWAIVQQMALEVPTGIDETFFRISCSTPCVDHAKNLAARDFMRRESDYLWVIDEDNPPAQHIAENFFELATLGLDIVACPTLVWDEKAARLGNWPWKVNCAKQGPGGRWFPLNTWGNDLVEVDAVGMGCTFVHRRVFEKVWPFFVREYDEDGVQKRGSDFVFCERAKKAGFRVWAHFGYWADHIKPMSFIEVFRLMKPLNPWHTKEHK